MAIMLLDADSIPTVDDLLSRLGGIPASRILLKPLPGRAKERDLLRLLDGEPKRLCELIDGTLVEKPMGMEESIIAGRVLRALGNFAEDHGLGEPCGADGPVRMAGGNVRLPDVSFFLSKHLPGGVMPKDSISKLIPDIAVEVVSKGNTQAEIARKREELFLSGLPLFWEIDPRKRIVSVYTSPLEMNELGEEDVLTGGTVLPGFEIAVRRLFGKATASKQA